MMSARDRWAQPVDCVPQGQRKWVLTERKVPRKRLQTDLLKQQVKGTRGTTPPTPGVQRLVQRHVH